MTTETGTTWPEAFMVVGILFAFAAMARGCWTCAGCKIPMVDRDHHGPAWKRLLRLVWK